jgi:adenosylcobinamide kinase/adenosylcobinamide-phosphate guanylyltransferase
MGKIIFILGGARSGKSRYAIKLAKKENSQRVAFIATCKPKDREMKERIALHKKVRLAHWQTFEEPKDVAAWLEKNGTKFEVILLDCLTLLISGLLLKNFKEDAIENKVNKILFILKKIKAKSIIVSNEVGLGIVPKNKLARNFRDIAGRMNQAVAEKSDAVFFLLSGMPLKIK